MLKPTSEDIGFPIRNPCAGLISGHPVPDWTVELTGTWKVERLD